MQPYIDAHCHIGNGTTDKNVVAFLCNSVDESDWTKVLKLSDENKAVYACLGIHPWRVNDIVSGWDLRLCALLSRFPHAMIGEIGLDKTRPDFDAQCDIFVRQIDIAADMKRAAHVHCVRAWGAMIDILQKMPALPPVIIIHGFGGAPEMIARFSRLKSRVYFSYSDAVMDTRRRNICASVQTTPQDRILIESDGPMSESGTVLKSVATTIADMRDTDYDTMAKILYNNATQVIKNG